MAPLINIKPKTRNNKPALIHKGLFLFILTVASFVSSTSFASSSVYAWGSITHVAICREVSSSSEFQAGGHSPDMIALNAVTTASSGYDYCHDLAGPAGLFGRILSVRGAGDFGRGWLAHQLADSVVHGGGGYSESKTVFSGLPERYRADLGHGTTELIIDAIVLEDRLDGDFSFLVPDKSRVIHEASVVYYNSSGGVIPRRDIISCRDVERLAARWEGWLITNKYLAELMTDELWFPAAKEDYRDYKPYFDVSVSLAWGETAVITRSQKLSRQLEFIGQLTAFLAQPVEARAAEAEQPEDNTGYNSFIMKLSDRARVIGGGKITKDSVRQAVTEIDQAQGLSDSERVWAAAMQEMLVNKNGSFAEIERKVAAYGREQARQKGASSGLKNAGFLPCLPLAALLSLTVAGIVWFARRIVMRR